MEEEHVMSAAEEPEETDGVQEVQGSAQEEGEEL